MFEVQRSHSVQWEWSDQEIRVFQDLEEDGRGVLEGTVFILGIRLGRLRKMLIQCSEDGDSIQQPAAVHGTYWKEDYIYDPEIVWWQIRERHTTKNVFIFIKTEQYFRTRSGPLSASYAIFPEVAWRNKKCNKTLCFGNSLEKKLLLAQNKVQWLALVKAVMIISALYKTGVSWPSERLLVSFLRR
jgi:hypothetical protein